MAKKSNKEYSKEEWTELTKEFKEVVNGFKGVMDNTVEVAEKMSEVQDKYVIEIRKLREWTKLLKYFIPLTIFLFILAFFRSEAETLVTDISHFFSGYVEHGLFLFDELSKDGQFNFLYVIPLSIVLSIGSFIFGRYIEKHKN